MVAVPAVTPDTIPDADPIVATPVLLLLQVPPITSSVKDDVPLRHTVAGPVMGSATAVLVIVMILLAVSVLQELVTEYNTVSVPPVLPVYTPAPEILPFILVAIHVPPVTASVSEIFDPVQTVEGPVITPAEDNGLMVTTIVAATLLQLLLSV